MLVDIAEPEEGRNTKKKKTMCKIIINKIVLQGSMIHYLRQ